MSTFVKYYWHLCIIEFEQYDKHQDWLELYDNLTIDHHNMRIIRTWLSNDKLTNWPYYEIMYIFYVWYKINSEK